MPTDVALSSRNSVVMAAGLVWLLDHPIISLMSPMTTCSPHSAIHSPNPDRPPDRNPNDPQFWEQHYQQNQTGWDLGAPAPALVHWLETAQPQPGRVIVLGCGRGYDAIALAERGFSVVAMDFAPSAVAAVQALARDRQLPITVIQQDLFALADPNPARPEILAPESFDYVVEHTCFCAIAPDRRDDYARAARSLLKPSGQFVGIFFTHDRPSGPPFGSTVTDLHRHFTPHFHLDTLAPASVSPPKRQGEEHFGQFRVRSEAA